MVFVGYFLLAGLASAERAQLLKNCLSFIRESGVNVTSITFDGASANVSMCSHLSSADNLKPFFPHLTTGENVYILLDPSHMIKLVRNAFGFQKQFKDMHNKFVNWHFLESLVKRQTFEGLHLATRLRQRHIEWTEEKMRVKLATQTLSKSVADALLYL